MDDFHGRGEGGVERAVQQHAAAPGRHQLAAAEARAEARRQDDGVDWCLDSGANAAAEALAQARAASSAFSDWMASAITETAISHGARAPMLSPMGAFSRAITLSDSPSAARRASRSGRRRRLPRAPTYPAAVGRATHRASWSTSMSWVA